MAETDTLQFVLGFVAAWALVYFVGSFKRVKERGFEVKPFFIMYKTNRINGFLDRFSTHRRFWNAVANISILVGIMLLVISTAFLLQNLLNYFFAPKNFSKLTVFLPGITIQSFSALAYFFLSIPFILIVHEGAHGVVARLEKIRVKSGGIVVLAALIGGFVEPDEEDFKKSKPLSRVKVVASGCTLNVIFSFAVALFLITQPAFASPQLNPILPSAVRSVFYGPASGIYILNVAEDGPAFQAGIRSNDILVSIREAAVKTVSDYTSLGLKPGETVVLGYERGGVRNFAKVTAIAATDKPERGILGFRAIDTYYPPRLSLLGYVLSPPIFLFVYFLWFLSLMIGAFNMLPLYPFDGDGLLNSLLDFKLSGKSKSIIRYSVNSFTAALLITNLLVSAISGIPII